MYIAETEEVQNAIQPDGGKRVQGVGFHLRVGMERNAQAGQDKLFHLLPPTPNRCQACLQHTYMHGYFLSTLSSVFD